MKSFLFRLVASLALVTILAFPACGSDGGETPDITTENGGKTTSPGGTEEVVITIGNLSDLTGTAAVAMEVINSALRDLVGYFNEGDIIPGVELKVVTYDGQYDPSRDIPGYEWLREKGADLIFTAVPGTPLTLKSRANRDSMVLFGVSGNPDDLSPPGYVFNLGTIPRHEALTMLKWIAENHWDYRANGPARIGGAGWEGPYTVWWLDSMKDYARAHPDQFEWVDGRLTKYGSFLWQSEVDALKDCDYVYVPTVMINFIKEYRDAGHDGTFIGASTHAAFMGQIKDARLWDEVDGMLFISSSRWWSEEGEIIDLTKEILYRNHPNKADEIIKSGVGYISIVNLYQMLSIIKNAVDEVGAQNFDSQALYDAAESYTLTIDGANRYSFSENKRWATDLYAVYQARADEEDLVRQHAEWLPVVTEP
ncbi:MAG: ABC transporter substrate-binding protein [Dehalococcoidia bacterium]